MPKYSMIVEYIGTNYAGSQIQPDRTTVQSVLESAFSILVKPRTLKKESENQEVEKTFVKHRDSNTKITFSGRTDKGVHSTGQVVHFTTDEPIVASRFVNSMNGLLPNDISVKDVKEVDDDFHAQLSAKYRVYRYKIVNRFQRSVWDGHSLLVREPLDLERMNRSLSFLVGEHDFTSFKSVRTDNPAKICTVYKAECTKSDDLIIFEIAANRFLYNMVRTIVGTLLQIEQNNLPPETMKEILDAKDRAKAGRTASPDGLTLVEVGYEPYKNIERN